MRRHNMPEIIDKDLQSAQKIWKNHVEYGKKIKMRTLKTTGTVMQIWKAITNIASL